VVYTTCFDHDYTHALFRHLCEQAVKISSPSDGVRLEDTPTTKKDGLVFPGLWCGTRLGLQLHTLESSRCREDDHLKPVLLFSGLGHAHSLAW